MENMFPNNLKYLRKQTKVPVAELADILGKGKSMWYNYENGANDPSIPDIITISNFFGISISDIIGKDLSNTDYKIQENIPLGVNESEAGYSIDTGQKIKNLKREVEKLRIEKQALLDALEAVGRGKYSTSKNKE